MRVNVNLEGVFFITKLSCAPHGGQERAGDQYQLRTETAVPSTFTSYCASKGGVKMMSEPFDRVAPARDHHQQHRTGTIETPINKKFLNAR